MDIESSELWSTVMNNTRLNIMYAENKILNN